MYKANKYCIGEYEKVKKLKKISSAITVKNKNKKLKALGLDKLKVYEAKDTLIKIKPSIKPTYKPHSNKRNVITIHVVAANCPIKAKEKDFIKRSTSRINGPTDRSKNQTIRIKHSTVRSIKKQLTRISPKRALPRGQSPITRSL